MMLIKMETSINSSPLAGLVSSETLGRLADAG